MTDANAVAKDLAERYAAAVNSNDSAQYRALFTADAVRSPPGMELERGPDAIAASEGKDYETYRFDIQMRPLDALQLGDDWVYCIAEVNATLTARADDSKKQITALKTFLLEKQSSGAWLIKRYQWNLK